MRKTQASHRHSLPEHLLSDEPTQHWWNRCTQWLIGKSRHKLRREQLLALQPSRVFNFLSDTTYFDQLAPPGLRLKLGGTLPLPLQEGQILEHEWRALGRQWKMKTKIERSVSPSVLEEVQFSGPFHKWRMLRRLRMASGGTWIIDDLEYELPWGILGRMMNRLYLRRKLERYFDYRQERTIAFLLPDAAQEAHATSTSASRSKRRRPEQKSESHPA